MNRQRFISDFQAIYDAQPEDLGSALADYVEKRFIERLNQQELPILSARQVMETCCAYFGISSLILRSTTKSQFSNGRRHIIIYLMKAYSRRNNTTIAKKVNRDRTTITHSLQIAEDLIEVDELVRADFVALSQILNRLPAEAAKAQL